MIAPSQCSNRLVGKVPAHPGMKNGKATANLPPLTRDKPQRYIFPLCHRLSVYDSAGLGRGEASSRLIAAPVFTTTVRTIECRISRQSHEESIAPSGTVAQFIEDINHRHCVALFAIGGGLLHTDYTGRNNADQPSTGANTHRSVNVAGRSNRYQYDPFYSNSHNGTHRVGHTSAVHIFADPI